MSCGEIISAVVVAAFLSAKGLRACALTGIQAGFLTDGRYGEAEVVDCQPFRIKEILQLNEIPVVTGFQGADAQGEINTLGRGGSDTSAVILGAALDAERVEIYTDVSGIMTADPLIIKEARVIQQITYGEVCQLAYEGARVIHPRAVEVAMRNNVRVMVKSLENPGTGTLITTEASLIKGNYSTRGEGCNGIAHETNLAQFLTELPIPDSSSELEIFRQIGEVSGIDLISVFPIKSSKMSTAEGGDHPEWVEVTLQSRKDCAKVSVG